MTDISSVEKDETVLVFLRALNERTTEWEMRDYWDGDLCAIGVVSAKNSELLAYVTSWQEPNGYYYLELEERAGSDAYNTVARIENCALVDVVDKVVQHFLSDQ
jgi:hypothetical protein